VRLDRSKIVHEDFRGSIVDIVVNEEFQHATMIMSLAGSVRGHHYHKQTIQKVFVVNGRMYSFTRKPGEEIVRVELCAGDVVTHEPNERHALVALTDCSFLVLTNGPRGGDRYESDTYREHV
jgi:quercetin dioxygenase-like cupin family protein